MMRVSFILLLLALSLQFSLGANAGSLWQGADTGMQLPEILSKFPDAVAVEGEALKSGDKEQARILHYEVSRIDFRVRFFFIKGKLTQITLSSNVADSQTVHKNIADAKNIEKI